MTNRWLRLLLVVLALGGTVGLGYRAWLDGQAQGTSLADARAHAATASDAMLVTAELRAALHAYVAPGQGQAFWTARVDALFNELRNALLSLDQPAAAASHSLTTSLDTVDRLAAAEVRARDYAGDGQALMAGDVIFIESRDLLNAVQNDLRGVGAAIESAAAARQAALSGEQSLLAAAAAALWLIVALLLVPVPQAVTAADGLGLPATPQYADLTDDIPELEIAGAGTRGTSATSTSGMSTSGTRGTLPAASASARAGSGASSGESTPEPPVGGEGGPLAPAVVPLTFDLASAASVCVDLARLSDSTAIGGLLARAAGVLGASGVIVWVSGADRSALFPVASFGYDERLFARIGSISENADNITAHAFRAADTRASAASGASPAALAVPLIGPAGAIGILSAEVPHVTSIEPPRAALAGIFAAQLATLVASLPPAAAAATDGEGEGAAGSAANQVQQG